VRGLTVLSRPHPAAFARSFALDPGQAARSSHHQSTTPEKTDLWHADDSAVLRAALSRAGVPSEDAEAYVRVLGQRDALDAAMNWYRAAAPTGGLARPDTPDAVVPVRYLWGTEDGSVGRVAAELTAQHVSGPYEFIEVPGGTHFLTDDAAASLVRDAIVEHVTAVGRSAP
jgi:pimeloyl-ACP methyl ester carboxylesterase